MTDLYLDDRTADLQTTYNICRWLLQNGNVMDAAAKRRIEQQFARVRVELCLAQSRVEYRRQMEV